MRTIKSLKRFSIILLVLVNFGVIYSAIEIFNVWTNESFATLKSQLLCSENLTLSDKSVFTVYQLLNISMILPAYWFYNVSKFISKSVFFESFVIKKFQQIGNYLYAVSAIAVIFPRFFSYDTSISEYLWYGVHPLVVMFLATLLLSFSVILKEALKQKQENDLTI